MTTRPALSNDTLAFLRGIDSPTIANAVETFNLRDRCDGFIGGAVECQFPELGVMAGRAVTVTMSSAPGAPASRDGYWRMWEVLDAADAPAVLAIQDVSGAPHRCAHGGEMMATLAQRLGAWAAIDNRRLDPDCSFRGSPLLPVNPPVGVAPGQLLRSVALQSGNEPLTRTSSEHCA